MRISKGFTLIELLIVIAVIGILATIITTGFRSPQAKARDARRQSDLKQYSVLLENYANLNNGLFPSYTTAINASGSLCTTLGASNCPDDPLLSTDPTYLRYRYISNGTGSGSATATAYVLWGRLESGANSYWVICGTGKVGKTTSAPTNSNCPL